MLTSKLTRIAGLGMFTVLVAGCGSLYGPDAPGYNGLIVAGDDASATLGRKMIGSEEGTKGNAWFGAAQETLTANIARKRIDRKARNVILFIGDGMDPTTVTAARIYDGQSKGLHGEENLLAFEKLPYVAMSKTYSTNTQVPDSAATASAMTTGVKTKSGTLGVNDYVVVGNCASALKSQVTVLGEWAERAGLATGVISTARVTHATPAAFYAHTAQRGWESDSDLSAEAKSAGCKDIATQMMDMPFGNGLDVVLGGGRSNFMAAGAPDPEYKDKSGNRDDGRDMTTEWALRSGKHKYVWNREDFLTAKPGTKLLGLFEPSHMQYEADRLGDRAGEPSLAEMTRKALGTLQRQPNGYVLMVEAGRIDHAHHRGNAARALRDVQAFDEAVAMAKTMTNDRDTLIIVTADHGHTMAIQGYPQRGNPILGLVRSVSRSNGAPEENNALAADKKPYTTLSYANGPGSVYSDDHTSASRPTLTVKQTNELDYQQQALIPMGSETHGGQDVQIFASGPQAFLFSGVVEQNYIFHVIDYAMQLRATAEK